MIADNYVLIVENGQDPNLVLGALQAKVEKIVKEGHYLPHGSLLVFPQMTQWVAIQPMLHRSHLEGVASQILELLHNRA